MFRDGVLFMFDGKRDGPISYGFNISQTGRGRIHVLGSFSKRKKNHENGKFGGGKGWPIFNS